MAGDIGIREGEPEGPASSASQELPARLRSQPAAAGYSLLDLLRQGTFKVPREHRDQKAFLRFFRKAGGNRKIIEQVHRLRDAVILSALNDGLPAAGITVALTGPRGGEGASFLSLFLGLSLGECTGRKVAIIDGSFSPKRFAALSSLFGLSQNSLSLEASASRVSGYCNELCPNVYFLKRSGGGMDLFSDRRLGDFVSELRQSFDFSIIDMPPLLRETACCFLLPLVDRLYLVVEAGKTRMAEVRRCVAASRQAGGKLSGIILNKQTAPLWSKLFWGEFFY